MPFSRLGPSTRRPFTRISPALGVSSPPTKWPCFYGIATPTREELIASSQSIEDITRFLEADSVGYLTLPALIGACDTVQGNPSRQAKYCHACFSGEYPIPFVPHPRQRQMRLLDC